MKFKNEVVETAMKSCPKYTGPGNPGEGGYQGKYQDLEISWYNGVWKTIGDLPCYAQLKYTKSHKGGWIRFSPPLSMCQSMDDWLFLCKKVFLDNPNPLHKGLVKDILDGLFGDEHPTHDEFCQEFLRVYGWVLPGEVLDKYPIATIYNFGIAQRAGWDHDGLQDAFKQYIELGATGTEALIYSKCLQPGWNFMDSGIGHWWFKTSVISLKRALTGDYLFDKNKLPFNKSQALGFVEDMEGWGHDQALTPLFAKARVAPKLGEKVEKVDFKTEAVRLIEFGRKLVA